MNHCVIETPAGRLLIWELYDCITECSFVNAPLREPETPLLTEAAKEIGEYFAGTRRAFELPIAPPASPEGRRVLTAILAIPYGKTMTSEKLAAKAGLARRVKSVVKVCNENPLAVLIPSHRVTAPDGDGGFVGGMEAKYALWTVEGIRKKEE